MSNELLVITDESVQLDRLLTHYLNVHRIEPLHTTYPPWRNQGRERSATDALSLGSTDGPSLGSSASAGI